MSKVITETPDFPLTSIVGDHKNKNTFLEVVLKKSTVTPEFFNSLILEVKLRIRKEDRARRFLNKTKEIKVFLRNYTIKVVTHLKGLVLTKPSFFTFLYIFYTNTNLNGFYLNIFTIFCAVSQSFCFVKDCIKYSKNRRLLLDYLLTHVFEVVFYNFLLILLHKLASLRIISQDKVDEKFVMEVTSHCTLRWGNFQKTIFIIALGSSLILLGVFSKLTLDTVQIGKNIIKKVNDAEDNSSKVSRTEKISRDIQKIPGSIERKKPPVDTYQDKIVNWAAYIFTGVFVTLPLQCLSCVAWYLSRYKRR